jgi:F-type H+-transporting ATPase subunit delta
MSVKAVARQYAHALFAVALRSQRTDEVGDELRQFSDLLASQPDLQKALASGAVPRQAKRALVSAVVENVAPVTDEFRRLLELLGENDRLSIIGDVITAYQTRALEAAGVINAELVTAFPLDAGRQDALAKALSHATGFHVEVTGRVDPSMIGGVVAKVGSVVYDGSVSRQLERMRQRLSAEG